MTKKRYKDGREEHIIDRVLAGMVAWRNKII
jgi:hypothetical protein